MLEAHLSFFRTCGSAAVIPPACWRVMSTPHVGAHHEAERAPGAGGQAQREQTRQRLVQRDVRQGGRAKQELSCLRPPSTRVAARCLTLLASESIAGQDGVQRLHRSVPAPSLRADACTQPAGAQPRHVMWLTHSTSEGSASTAC